MIGPPQGGPICWGGALRQVHCDAGTFASRSAALSVAAAHFAKRTCQHHPPRGRKENHVGLPTNVLTQVNVRLPSSLPRGGDVGRSRQRGRSCDVTLPSAQARSPVPRSPSFLPRGGDVGRSRQRGRSRDVPPPSAQAPSPVPPLLSPEGEISAPCSSAAGGTTADKEGGPVKIVVSFCAIYTTPHIFFRLFGYCFFS